MPQSLSLHNNPGLGSLANLDTSQPAPSLSTFQLEVTRFPEQGSGRGLSSSLVPPAGGGLYLLPPFSLHLAPS